MPTCARSSKEPGIPCLCTSFVPRPPPKVGKCKICGHRHSSHVDNPPGSSSKYLSRLLKNIDATAVHEEARKETNQGFHPQQSSSSTVALPDIGKGKGKATHRASARIASGQNSSGIMKIGRIIVFPCGTENLSRFRFPAINSASLASWVEAGLAVEANPNNESSIVFHLSWGTKEFNDFLRNLFPILFNYLGMTNPHILGIQGEPDDIGPKRINYSWPYVLLKKVRKKYEAVDCTHPTALIYKDNLSGEGAHASFRGKSIFLATKRPIPQQIVNKWFAPAEVPNIPSCLPAGKRGRDSSSSSSPDVNEMESDEIEIVEPPKPAKSCPRSTKHAKTKISKIDLNLPLFSLQPESPPLPKFIEGSSGGGASTALTTEQEQEDDTIRLASRLQASALFSKEDFNEDNIWNQDRSDQWSF